VHLRAGWRRRADERGAVAVEMALLLPILLILVLGIVQYGLWFYARQGGSDAARDAARRAAVGDPATCAAFRAQVAADLGSYRENPEDTVITRTYQKADPARVQVGDTVTVKVAFDSHDMNVPLVPVPKDGRVDLTVKARVEFVPKQPEVCS
jgi:Flp pilus assembly protein TadG